MAVIPLDTDTLRNRTLEARVDLHLCGTGFGVNPYLERRARMDELRRLDRMSDAELARAGLSRDTLVAHVFSGPAG
jgi:hypothetical protein